MIDMFTTFTDRPNGIGPLIATEDSLTSIRLTRRQPGIVLVLDRIQSEAIFAGLRTALLAGVVASELTERPLQIVILTQVEPDKPPSTWLVEWMQTALNRSTRHGVEVIVGSQLQTAEFNPDDIWIATYWTTAHALARACRAERIHPARVIYLVQDFEPGFFPWGDHFALARRTYDEGFNLLVNSAPLASYLQHSGVHVPERQVFVPAIDTEAVGKAATEWRPPVDGRLRVLWYARPSKPRNLFQIGLHALELWINRFDGDRPLTVASIGELHDPIQLSDGVKVESLGTVSLAEYYDVLSATDIGLSLMYSPHPSHLALEMPLAGIPTVTNTTAWYRESWVDDLLVVDPDPESLCQALEYACQTAKARIWHTAKTLRLNLGYPLPDAIRHAIDESRKVVRTQPTTRNISEVHRPPPRRPLASPGHGLAADEAIHVSSSRTTLSTAIEASLNRLADDVSLMRRSIADAVDLYSAYREASQERAVRITELLGVVKTHEAEAARQARTLDDLRRKVARIEAERVGLQRQLDVATEQFRRLRNRRLVRLALWSARIARPLLYKRRRLSNGR